MKKIAAKMLEALKTTAKRETGRTEEEGHTIPVRKTFAILGVVLPFMTIWSCVNSCSGRVVLDPNTIRAQAGRSELKFPSRTDVRISTISQSDASLLFKVENLTDRSIFISYQPSEENGRAVFLNNYVERREPGDTEFRAIEPIAHFVPLLNTIQPGESILFAPIRMPDEAGEYRVHVLYIEDESLCRLINEKLPFDWSPEEKIRVSAAWKTVYSETFTIKN
jgi:hypothetical protein